MIRSARIDDARDIAEVLVAAWKWAYPRVVPNEMMEGFSNLSERERRIREHWDPNFLYLVAEAGGSVVGLSREGRPVPIPGYDASIGSLYVHPDHARSGHGGRLFRAMAAGFADRGHRSMCIQTLRDNRIGRGFYEKHGGVVVAEDEWSRLPAVWYGWPDVTKLDSPTS